MKIADIDIDKLSEGLGLCPKNLQGTSPLTHFRALPEPALAEGQEKGAVAPFLLDRIIREPYVKELSRHILVPLALRYSTVSLTTVPLRLHGGLSLHIKDCLLSKEDQDLPLAGHVISSL